MRNRARELSRLRSVSSVAAAMIVGCGDPSASAPDQPLAQVEQAFSEANCLNALPDFTNIGANGAGLPFEDESPVTYDNPKCFRSRVLRLRDINFPVLSSMVRIPIKRLTAIWSSELGYRTSQDCELSDIGIQVYTDFGASAMGATPTWTLLATSRASGTWSGVCNSPLRAFVDIPAHNVGPRDPAWTYHVDVTARRPDGSTTSVMVHPSYNSRDVWFAGRIGASSGQFVEAGGSYENVTMADLWFASKVAMKNGHLAPKRFAVVDNALNELNTGLCGTAAVDKYAPCDDLFCKDWTPWCSEFAAFIYGRANINMKRCTGYPLDERGQRTGPCNSWASISSSTNVRNFIDVFESYTGAWFPRTNGVLPIIPDVGDYAAMVGSEGHLSHSGVVVGTSATSEWIWTVEGNRNAGDGRGDCVNFVRRPFYSPQTGTFDGADLDGFGSISPGY